MSQWMYGKNVVRQLLDEKEKVICIAVTNVNDELAARAKQAGIKVKQMDKKTLARLTGTDRHQGIAAEIEDIRLYSVDELIRDVKPDKGLLIMLDELEDPHNLGAVLRTADAVGADGVIFKKTHSVGLTPTVAKVSAGAVKTVKCAAVTNLSRTLEDLKKKGWWAVAADMDGKDYRSLDYDFNTVLIIGNEGKGISRLLMEKCDHVISLPMYGKITSLNASVSAGILMYEISSKRNPVK